jgi:tetratricopeptide (TPR) repeat protein
VTAVLRALAAILLALALAGAARAEEPPRWPQAAEKRFEEARDLQQHGRYALAAARFREVADWPEGGPFAERAQALYCSALNLENGRELERALETYREVVRRFPASLWATRARQSVETLDPEGGHGLEFRRRQNEAWDVFQPATELLQRGKPDEARPGLERAAALFEALLHDHADHPRAADAALALGEARMRLGAFEAAAAAFGRSVELARREAVKPGSGHPTEEDVKNAEERLAEARRAIRRQLVDRGAWVLLAAITLILVGSAPWRRVTARVAALGGALLLVAGVLAAIAVALAAVLRSNLDNYSPIATSHAILLVLVPATIGIVTTLGLAAGRRGRGAALGAAAGVLAALAAAVIVVYACGLFPFLDSDL